VNEEALVELHQYSMLQRFRKNKDFKQADKYKPTTKQSADYYTSNKDNKWWLTANKENVAAN
jgi:hypothetical protein